jgi:hypothetical protein
MIRKIELHSSSPSKTSLSSAKTTYYHIKTETNRAHKWKIMLQKVSTPSSLDVMKLKSHPKFCSRVYKGIPYTWKPLVWLSLVMEKSPDSQQCDLYKVS